MPSAGDISTQRIRYVSVMHALVLDPSLADSVVPHCWRGTIHSFRTEG